MNRSAFVAASAATALNLALLRAPARAQAPYVRQGRIELGRGASLLLLTFAPERGTVPVECTAVVLPRAAFRARIFERSISGNASQTVAEVGRQAGAAVCVNGGFFTDAYAPDGLLRVDGKTLSPARRDFSDAFAIAANGEGEIVHASESGRYPSALQGNPTLVELGGAMGMRRENNRRDRRTFVAQSGQSLIVGVTSFVTLYHIADVLVQFADAFGLPAIDGAINLGGSATSAMYVPLPNGGEISHQERWVNRDFLAFI